MPPWGIGYGQPRPPADEEDLSAGYESMIRGENPHGLDLMRLIRRPAPFYGPSQGIAGPVPRRTSGPADPGMYGPARPAVPPQETRPYDVAMGLPDEGPPEPAIRVPEQGGQEGLDYHGMVDDYLRSLTQPYHLPESAPYSRREKLGMLAAREPWQREVIAQQHREPYERAMAEAQIGERRRSGAAGIASDMEKAQAYDRYRLAREGQPSQELDYTDKVEKAQADVGNADYPYTRRQWKALANFKAQTAAGKLPTTKEAAIEDIDRQISGEEGRYLQATSDPLRGFMPETELEGGRKSIVGDIQAHRANLMRRRKAISGMTPDIYQKFRNLSGDQQEEVLKAYEKRASDAEAEREQQYRGSMGPTP